MCLWSGQDLSVSLSEIMTLCSVYTTIYIYSQSLSTCDRMNWNRVWNYQTKRMIHQLAGHSQKITCVRLLPGEKSIVTASADRSIRVWDISRHVYTQTTTFRHSSTSNCCDISYETHALITGHLDGTFFTFFLNLQITGF